MTGDRDGLGPGSDAYFDRQFEINARNELATQNALIEQLQATNKALLEALVECLREHGGFTIKGECERKARAAIKLAKGET